MNNTRCLAEKEIIEQNFTNVKVKFQSEYLNDTTTLSVLPEHSIG